MPIIRARFKKVGGSWMLALPPQDVKDLDPAQDKEVPIIIPTDELVGFGAYPDLALSLIDETEDEIGGED